MPPLAINPLARATQAGIMNRCLASTEQLFTSVGRASLSVASIVRLADTEHTYWSEYPLPVRHRVRAWRLGFTSRDYLLLNLAENDPAEYLSSREHAAHVHPAVNQQYQDILRNKVAFYLATAPHTDCVPTVFGTIHRGEFIPLNGAPAYTDLGEVVTDEGDVIIKPTTGTMGRGVHHITQSNGRFAVNDQAHSHQELRERTRDLDGYLVTAFVEQHAYARSICPGSTNTIRILTLPDPDEHGMLVASAVHRFGNNTTGPVDNWSGGGFAAPVDLERGELGQLRTYSRDQGLRHLDAHPDTGTRVTGQTIPDWDRIRSTVTEVAELHREIPYVGWDVVLARDRPMILEGNPAPHLALQQLGYGIFADDRVRRAFDKYIRV